MNEDNVAIRLKGFIDEMGLTNSQFADTCGIPRPSLSQILSGRNKKISDVIVGQIHMAFPQLSVLWLLFGEGDMLMSSPVASSSASSASNDSNLFGENNLFSDNQTEQNIFSNLKALNDTKNIPNPGDRNGFNSENKTKELLLEIEKLRKNPRKVTQITLYYDDSTFETFYPGK